MRNNGHILIVDDDSLLCQTLGYQLQQRGYGCRAVQDAEAAINALAAAAPPTLVILDYFLGVGTANGLELCRSIRALTGTPVIMLTANEHTQTIVSCLDAGAAQYMVKPYDIEELTARIRVVMRENPGPAVIQAQSRESMLHMDSLTLNPIDKLLSVGETQIELTEKEAAVLELMFSKPAQTVARSTLYRVVYGKHPVQDSRAMDVLIGRTRKKLESLNCDITIRSVRGEGYLLQPMRSNLPPSGPVRRHENA
ncbi:MAG: response regulator transcription factor [Haliea sp.]